MVKNVPQGQWFLGRWEEGATIIDAASFRDKKGRWWRAEVATAANQFFASCPIRQLHGHDPFRSINA